MSSQRWTTSDMSKSVVLPYRDDPPFQHERGDSTRFEPPILAARLIREGRGVDGDEGVRGIPCRFCTLRPSQGVLDGQGIERQLIGDLVQVRGARITEVDPHQAVVVCEVVRDPIERKVVGLERTVAPEAHLGSMPCPHSLCQRPLFLAIAAQGSSLRHVPLTPIEREVAIACAFLPFHELVGAAFARMPLPNHEIGAAE